MAENESIGAVSVSVTGDLSGLGPSFSAAQSQAQAAGAAIAGSFNTGAAAANQFTVEIDRLIEAMQQQSAAATLATQRNAAMARSFQSIGQSAQQGGFSVRYMFLGLKDIAEGRSTFALAELSNVLVRMGPAALAIGVAAAAVVGPFVAYMHSMAEAAKITEKSIDDVSAAYFRLNDELNKLNTSHVSSIFGPAAGKGAEAADIEQQAKRIKEQIDDVTTAMNFIGRAEGLKNLIPGHTAVTNALVQKSEGEIKALILEQEGLEARAKALREDQARLAQGEGGTLSAKNIESAEQASQRAAQISKQQADAELALQHSVQTQRIQGLESEYSRVEQTGQEEIRFAKAKADDIAAYALATRDRLIEEIAAKARAELAGKTKPEQALITAGASADTSKARDEYTETTGKAALAVQEAQAKATLAIIELNQKLGQTLRDDVVRGWDAVAEAERETAKLFNEQISKGIIAEQRSAEINEKASGENAALLIGRQKIALESQYALQIGHTRQQEIDYANQLAALDDRENTARLTGLARELQTAEAVSGELRDEIRIADIKAKLQSESGHAQNQAAGTAGKNAAAAQQNSIGAQVQTGLTNAISGSLAKGIMDGGKGLGKDLENSLKSVGQNLLKSIFDELIVALIENTLATEINTIATEIKAFFGFAGGTDFAPGGPALVGEKGPEIVNLPRGSQVIPNHAIKKYASGTPGYQSAYSSSSTGDTHVTVNLHGQQSGPDVVDHVIRALPARLKQRNSQFAALSR